MPDLVGFVDRHPLAAIAVVVAGIGGLLAAIYLVADWFVGRVERPDAIDLTRRPLHERYGYAASKRDPRR